MNGIRIENLSKTFRRGRVRALDGVSLAIEPGEAFGIIGPNGAGKTTLMGCLLGLVRPDSGTLSIDGHAPYDLAVRRVTGYLPERLVLDRWMTGLDFLAYHHALARLDPGARASETHAALERVGLEPEAGRQTIGRYSRGMLQRLGLAQALLGSPRFVFLDEPISGVDPAGVVLFRGLLAELKRNGATLIVNSHQLDEVERVCDRVAFVQRGHVESVETTRAGEAASRVLVVRWAGGAAGAAASEEVLARAASSARARLVEARPPLARFAVPDDDGATRLLQSLLSAGVPVVEATPEGGRLERLFVSADAAALSSPPAAPSSPPAVPMSPQVAPPPEPASAPSPFAGPHSPGASAP
jgi:ABC-2 type transport system ATP-binding protein